MRVSAVAASGGGGSQTVGMLQLESAPVQLEFDVVEDFKDIVAALEEDLKSPGDGILVVVVALGARRITNTQSTRHQHTTHNTNTHPIDRRLHTQINTPVTPTHQTTPHNIGDTTPHLF